MCERETERKRERGGGGGGRGEKRYLPILTDINTLLFFFLNGTSLTMRQDHVNLIITYTNNFYLL